jgi:hypothetical protein
MSPLLISIDDVGRLLGVNPQSIREQAHRDPKKLGFPVSVVGTRVLIPKEPFYKFIGLEEAKENDIPTMA